MVHGPQPQPSAHRWHRKLGTDADARWPSRSDRLELGVEPNALGPMHVVISEEGCLPAAEGMERHRDRDRNVDANHANLDLMSELPSRVTIPSEDGGAVAELVLVDHVGGGVIGLYACDGEHRAEDLFAIDLHIGHHVIEQ